MHNHLENNESLVTKKGLFLNLKEYFQCLKGNHEDIVPITFHLKNYKDPEIKKFTDFFQIRQ